MPYRTLEGITMADTAFEATGATLEELFRDSIDAITQVMLTELEGLGRSEARLVALEAPDPAELLHLFLEKVVYLKDVDQLLLRVGSLRVFQSSKGWELEARLEGEVIDPDRHALGVDVKAVTQHHFRLERTGDGFRATVVLDI